MTPSLRTAHGRTNRTRRTRLSAAGLAAVLVIVGATAGGDGAAPDTPTDPELRGAPYTLRVLSSSELADLRPVLDDAARATGVSVAVTSVPTRAGARTVANGEADARFDATWLASNRYLTMFSGGLARTDASSHIMTSPVILGLRASVARRLGWQHPAGTATTWAAIAQRAAAGDFTFGMADPVTSDSSLSALVSIATAVADTGAALRAEDVPRAAPRLRGMFQAQALTADSASALSDAYLRRQGRGARVDGLIGYESELLVLNASGRLDEPLVPVYPADGVAFASYPLTLLASAPDQAKDAYRRLVRYLRGPGAQHRIMELSKRRPAVADVPLDPFFGDHHLVELPFPDTADAVDDLVAAYRGTLRRPARTGYVLDTSGSMGGARIAALKRALVTLTGAGESPAGRFTRFQEREQVTLLPFSDRSGPVTTVNLPVGDPGPALDRIRRRADGLRAGGGTALYDALARMYRVIGEQASADPDRITTIVLLTDGENNAGRLRDLAAFTAFYRRLAEGVAAVPVYPILLGQASAGEMRRLASLTGGRVYDARARSLVDVFGQLRTSQ